MKIVIAIIIFSLIVIFHELGHFWLAKANGILVNEFSLGLGPTIIGFKRGETKYSLKLLPFGGACMMEGEDGESENPRSFQNKSVWARISVVLAGPVFNFILAFVFSFIMITAMGYNSTKIAGVIDGYAADEAGMQDGDTIVKLNNSRVHFFGEIGSYAALHEGEDVLVTYERDGKRYQTTLSPAFNEEEGRYLYGFQGCYPEKRSNVFHNLLYAGYDVGYYIKMTFESLRMLFSGAASMNDLSGPVGIVSTMGEDYEQAVVAGGIKYGLLDMCAWMVLISANLGVMNLLPIPALDGGRLVFLLIEAVTKKRVPPEKEGMVHMIGIVLLMLLMVVVMFNDIRKLFI